MRITVFFILCGLFFANKLFAVDSLSYSGRLVNMNGSPVAGPVNLKIELAYTSAPATILCSEIFNNIVLSNGVFHLKLDLDCGASTLTDVLAQIPAGEKSAIRVTDVTNNKTYAFQALHSMPFSKIAETAKQLSQMGATSNQVLKWNSTAKKWEPGSPANNGTVTNVTADAPLSVANGSTVPNVTITKADTTTDGYISATDWNIFNGKQGSIATGTPAQYYRGDKSWQTLDTNAVPEGSNLYFTNAKVLGVPLTAFSTATGAIIGTDNILEAFGKTQGQIDALTTAGSNYLIKNGTDTLSGTVSVTNVITATGLGDIIVNSLPLTMTSAVNKTYVDTADGLKVTKTGDVMSGVLTLDSDLRIKGGSSYVTLKGHVASTAYELFLPGTAGTPGYVLSTDGSGNTSWINPSSVSAGSGTVTSVSIVDGTIVDLDISGSAAIAQSKIANLTTDLAAKQSTTLANGNILIGSAGNVATAVAVSGDATIANTGVLTLKNTGISGTYTSVTTDAQGRVTGGTNPTLVTGVSVTAPITNSGTAAVPLIEMPAATTVADGYLPSIDWNTFNNKQAAITAASAINTGSITSNLQGGVVVNPYGAAAGNTGELRLKELVANGVNYVSFKAPDIMAADVTYVLPSADGSSGQVLTTNAAGVLSWTTVATGGTNLVGDVGGTIGANSIGAGKVSLAHLSATGTTNSTTYLRGDNTWSVLQTDVQALLLSAYTLGTNAVVTAGDSVVSAFGKLQKQISDLTTSAVGGDLAGNLPNPTIAKIQTVPVTISSLTTKNVLKYNGTAWVNSMVAASDLSSAGTTDATTYLAGDNTWKSFNTGVIAAPLTGLSTTGINYVTSPLASTDSITVAFNKLLFTQGDYVSKSVDQTINGNLKINSLTGFITVPDPIAGKDAANKDYVDGFGQWVKGASSSIYYTAGNVGIGIATPSSMLHISGDAGSALIQRANSSGADYSASLAFLSSRGTTGATTVSLLNDFVGKISFGGYDGSAYTNGSRILGKVDTTPSAGNVPNALIFETGTNTVGLTERMRISSTGNVGIGTSTPLMLLEVSKSQDAATSLDVNNTSNSSAASSKISVTSSGAEGHIYTTSDSYVGNFGTVTNEDSFVVKSSFSKAAARMFVGTGSSAPLHFISDNQVRATLTSDGNFGIGTTTPNQKLAVRGAPIAGQSIVAAINNPYNYGVGQGTAAATFLFQRDPNSGAAGYMAGISGGNETEDTSTVGYLAFSTRTGVPEVLTERMRINSAGNVGIGTGSPVSKLEVVLPSGGGEMLRLVGGTYTNRIFGTGFRFSAPASTSNYNRQFSFKADSSSLRIHGIDSTGTYAADTAITLQELGGQVGIGTLTPQTKLDVNGAVRVGSDAIACSAMIAGAMRFNTPNVEFCNGSSWQPFGTGDSTLSALGAFNTNGILVQTATDTFVGRTITGTANRLTVDNGDGVGGNPTINIATALLPSPVVADIGKFLRATAADASAWVTLALADITTALGFTPINKAGDTISTGVFTFNGAAVLRTLDPIGPTDVATRQFVESYGQWTKSGSDLYRPEGKVGIGTVNPLVPLDVVSTSASTNTVTVGEYLQRKTTGTAANGLGVAKTYVLQDEAGTLIATNSIASTWVDATAANRYARLDFYSAKNNTQSLAMSIDQNGKVGVGTVWPASKMHIEGAETAVYTSSSSSLVTPATASSMTIQNSSPVDGSAAYLQIISRNTSGGNNYSYIGSVATASAVTPSIVFGQRTGATAYSERMRIDSNGRVGIGIDSPQASLHITNGGASGSLSLSGGSSHSLIKMGNKDSLGSSGPNVIRAANRAIAFGVGTDHTDPNAGTFTEYFRINPDGNVGIGTANPTSKLFVNAAANAGPSGLVIDGKTRQASETNVPLLQVDAGLAGANGTALWVNTSGNVGIGTSTPASKLEVAGNIQLSGGGTIVQEAWITPAYQNGWLDYSSSGNTDWGPTAYYKGADGRVYLKGLVRAGTCGTVIFTLPVGYRPSKHRLFASLSSDLMARVNVGSNGDVSSTVGCNNTWVSLDGISFRVVGD